jgi:predicted nucleotidyltransferase
MLESNHLSKLIQVANEIRGQRYPDCAIVFLAGSLVRGEGTSTSDLDLVVVFDELPSAYRESFRFERWPVEAFVHDPTTLKYFFIERDRPSGVPSLAAMVSEGIEVPKTSVLSESLKDLANEILAGGPPLWSDDDVDQSRYMITSLVDDLRDPRSIGECMASGARLYEAMANHYLRSRGLWAAKDKTIPRKLEEADPQFSAKFISAFSSLFRDGDAAKVTELAEALLEQHGGWLFEGYIARAPKQWRRE